MPNAETAGAREALDTLLAHYGLNRMFSRDEIERFRDEHYPAPAPRKVRAGAHGFVIGGDSVWHDKAHWGTADEYCMSRTTLRELAALDARADAEGMVEEGLGAVDASSTREGGTERDIIGRSADVPAPPPTPSASPEADERTWGVETREDGLLVVTSDIDEQGDTERELDDAMDTLGNLIAERVKLRSELAYVQRESDSAHRANDELLDERHKLKVELARVQRERDEAVRRAEDEANARIREAERTIATLCAERDAALERARVAEQRIERGVLFFIDKHGHGYMGEPTPRDTANCGVITRGRFVADTEET